MRIDVKLTLNPEFVAKDLLIANAATGWVELENAIKFPVRVLQNKERRLFVKYPQMNKEGVWENVLFPVEKDAKEEIDDAVLKEFHVQIFKRFEIPEITGARVTILPKEENSGKVTVKAMATIHMCGCAINGLSVKEGESGLFVQMPQYRDKEGNYHDYVYGTNSFVQAAIKEAVLEEYHKQVELSKTLETPKTAEYRMPPGQDELSGELLYRSPHL